MSELSKFIDDYLASQIDCINEIRNSQVQVIETIINVLLKARENNNKIFVMGNGGSSSTASHFTSDLLKTTITANNKKRFFVCCLSDNVPVISAYSNDLSYEEAYKELLVNMVSAGDVVIGISGSGRSKNIIKALEYAKSKGAVTIGMTGMGGNEVARIAEISFVVPSDYMLETESMHLLIFHLITTAIMERG